MDILLYIMNTQYVELSHNQSEDRLFWFETVGHTKHLREVATDIFLLWIWFFIHQQYRNGRSNVQNCSFFKYNSVIDCFSWIMVHIVHDVCVLDLFSSLNHDLEVDMNSSHKSETAPVSQNHPTYTVITTVHSFTSYTVYKNCFIVWIWDTLCDVNASLAASEMLKGILGNVVNHWQQK